MRTDTKDRSTGHNRCLAKKRVRWNKNDSFEFTFIENSTDSSALNYIQTFKCISKKGDDLISLYRAIKVQAKNKVANCFKFRNFERDKSGLLTLTLATYHGGDSVL